MLLYVVQSTCGVAIRSLKCVGYVRVVIKLNSIIADSCTMGYASPEINYMLTVVCNVQDYCHRNKHIILQAWGISNKLYGIGDQ